MNFQQVMQAFDAVQTTFNNPASYSDLSVEGVIQYLNVSVAQVGQDLQLAGDCVGKFDCRGYKAEARLADLADLAESFGLEDHVGVVRNLMCVFGTEHGTQL